ncbi:hypothetical protein [Thiomonas sp.]
MTEGVMSVPQTTDVSDAMQAMSAMAYAGSR